MAILIFSNPAVARGKMRVALRVLLFNCLVWSVICPAARADDKPLQLYEQKIKAGLVYNLVKYTTWPQSSVIQTQAKLVICLFGNDPFAGYLAPLNGRTAQEASIFISQINAINAVGNCNVIVVHRSEEENLEALLLSIRDKNILTISDINEFSHRGGMIELTKKDEKINLFINKQSLAKAGLGMQERMLKLATIVAE